MAILFSNKTWEKSGLCTNLLHWKLLGVEVLDIPKLRSQLISTLEKHYALVWYILIADIPLILYWLICSWERRPEAFCLILCLQKYIMTK